jgi:PAS domain S-box-containing protein
VTAQVAQRIGQSIDAANAGRDAAVRDARRSEQTFLSYMEHGPFTAFIRDSNGRYIYVNPLFARMYNSTNEGIRHKTSREIGFPEDLAAEVMADDQRVLSTGVSSARTVEMQHFDGCQRQWFAVKFPLIDASGATVIGGVALDLSARVQAEKAKEEAQNQLVKAYKLAALGEMAGNIAHEINNPLAIIDGKAKQLCEILAAPTLDTKTAIKFGETISAMALRLVKIVNGLRNVSRASNNDPFTPKAVAALIEETVALCAPKLKVMDIELKTNEIAPDLALTCRPAELSQVLLNLISNAADAIENQEDRWISVDVSASATSVRIRIVDSGPGIPKEIRGKICEPFFTTKPVDKGTGLGLSISTQLVAAHGGTLALDELSPHTCFVVHLPRHVSHGEKAS